MEAHEALERFEQTHEHHDHAKHDDGSSLPRRAALLVSIIAAFLAISTFLGNEAVKEAIQEQTQVAAAQSDRQTFETQDLLFQSDSLLLMPLSQASDPQLAKVAKAMQTELDKQLGGDEVKKETEKRDEAIKEHMDEVKKNNDKHLLYELAEVLLQIAIVLASVSIIAKRSFLLFGGGGIGAVGVVLLVIGFVST